MLIACSHYLLLSFRVLFFVDLQALSLGGGGSGSSVGLRGAQTASSASTWGGGSSSGGFGGGGVSQPPQPPHECLVRVKARPYTPADDIKPRRPVEPSSARLSEAGAAALAGVGPLSR